MATDYTDGLALKAMKNIFKYLPSAYENGANDPIAREKMADASCMAGMAFANAFLGVCHSMAHKLGAFHHLPHENGANDPIAREKMADASCMAGMAFANAFLGVCHSMAHKLGAFHHLPHGVANALLINEVMKFNATDVPTKMGTFSQYQYPHALERYAECARFVGVVGKDDKETFEKFLEKIDEI